MKKIIDVMIDLETLGTDTDSVILSIGLCKFSLDDLLIHENSLELFPSVESQIGHGRFMDFNTIQWWMKQNKEAQERTFQSGRVSVENALHSIAGYIKDDANTEHVVWGNGSSFDISMLEHLFKMYNIKVPWRYSNVNDFRTFRRFVADNRKSEAASIEHSAVHDAVAQARFVIQEMTRRKYGT